jgi:hypothetical protein
MQPVLRLALVVLGIALAIYGGASLTGCWLGEPPWWRTKTHEWDAITADDARILKRTGVAFRADGAYYPRPGREWISGGVLVVGLGLAIVSRALRITLVVLGLAAAVYGIASLTGGWLGTPPWWEHEALGSDSGMEPVAFPRRGRESVSERLVLVGLGVAVLGAWPWRRRPPTSV